MQWGKFFLSDFEDECISCNYESLSDLISECSEASFLSDFEDECISCNYDLSNGSPIDTENFNIVHYNINSILAPGKLDQLADHCKLLKVDVLIITESKLDETIPTNLIILPGYHEPIRQDRQNNGRYGGGGGLMYINEDLVFQHKQNFQNINFEHIWSWTFSTFMEIGPCHTHLQKGWPQNW